MFDRVAACVSLNSVTCPKRPTIYAQRHQVRGVQLFYVLEHIRHFTRGFLLPARSRSLSAVREE